ncbi:hypothetical protein GCM10020000_78520 [Streptomyces olivoverticillatus]
MSLLHHAVAVEPFAELSCFRGEFYACLTARADAQFELADAVLCADGPVRSLVELSLVGEHRRGHGSLYGALAVGRVDVARLRRALAAVPLPRAADGGVPSLAPSRLIRVLAMIEFSDTFLNEAERHAAWGAAQLQALTDFLPQGPWTADLPSCLYRQGSVELRVAVLGTYGAEEQSWMWGWANPGLRGTPVVALTEDIERFGRARGIAEFTAEVLDLSGFADPRRAAETLAFAGMGVTGAPRLHRHARSAPRPRSTSCPTTCRCRAPASTPLLCRGPSSQAPPSSATRPVAW